VRINLRNKLKIRLMEEVLLTTLNDLKPLIATYALKL
jgi:hypothetical protein